MLKRVRKKHYQVGMYIELEKAEMRHPFIRSEFILNSTHAVDTLAEYYDSVMVDFSKSQLEDKAAVLELMVEKSASAVVSEVPDLNSVGEEVFSELIASTNSDLPAKDKALQLFEQSGKMMEYILSQPITSQLIQDCQLPIHALTECIIHDKQVATYLLTIASPDYSTAAHCANTGIKALLITRNILPERDSELYKELGVSYFLHDIGKTKLDPALLKKDKAFTKEEIEELHKHPEYGVKLLESVEVLTPTMKVIVEQHHEKMDGSGYPKGLKGRSIHPYAQICALADVYDELTSIKPALTGHSVFSALKVMKNEMKDHFDPRLLNGVIELFVDESKQLH